MTLPKEVTELIETWFAEHGRVELSCKNGKDELLSAVMATQHFHGAKKGDVEISLKYQIRKLRGVINPSKTRKAHKKRKIGDPTSHAPENVNKTSEINNPRNNPINNPRNNPINISSLWSSGGSTFEASPVEFETRPLDQKYLRKASTCLQTDNFTLIYKH